MAEERFCPHCGRANPKAMPRCMNCGQRVIKGGVSGMMLLEEEASDVVSRAPWWQTDPASAIPPPPQVREELARAEAKQRDSERRSAEENRFQERLKAHEESRIQYATQTVRTTTPTNAAKTKMTVGNCQRCGTPVGEAGAVFSFCLNCGADVSATTNGFAKPNGAGAFGGAGVGQRQTSFTAANPGYQSAFQTQQQQTNQQTLNQNQTVTQRTTSPGAAALFSFFIPGVGQMMNGQVAKGILLLLGSIVFTGILTGVPAAGLIRLALSIIAAIDAYRVADRKREGKRVRTEEWDLG